MSGWLGGGMPASGVRGTVAARFCVRGRAFARSLSPCSSRRLCAPSFSAAAAHVYTCICLSAAKGYHVPSPPLVMDMAVCVCVCVRACCCRVMHCAFPLTRQFFDSLSVDVPGKKG